MNKKLLVVSLLMLVLVLSACSMPTTTKVLSADEAKAKAVDFINKNLVEPGTTVTIDNVSEESGLYKLSVKLSTGQSVDSYMTKDGTKFFTQALDIAQIESEAANQNANANTNSNTNAAPTTTKSDKPDVQLFVMSQCPYGTQIEKGIIPVVQLLGSKINFDIKFVYYSMHGPTEINEEMNQVCIKKIASADYLTYLQCYLKAGDGAGCLKSTNIDSTKLSSCVSALDKQYSITKNSTDSSKLIDGQYAPFDVYKADNTKYSVEGSPALVINGQQQSDSARDPESLLKTICAAFNKQPSECSKTLSSASPTPGFGTSTSTTSDSASCGN